MTTTIKPRLPVSNISVCDGSNNKLTIVTGPCILVKATTATTVAQQVQALRPLKQIKPNEEPESLRCKRRIDFQRLGYTLPKAQPATVHRRNARERNRVKLVNLGFETLREHVPNGKVNKKLSKVETLRSAVEYIRELQNILNACDHHEPQSPVDMDTSNNNNSFDSTPTTSDVDCIIGNSGSPGTTSDASSLSSSSSSSSGEQELNVSNVMTSSCFPTSGELSGEQMMSCEASSPCSDSSDSSYDSLSSIDDSDILKFSRWLTQLYSSAMQDSLPDFTDSQIRPDSLQMSSNVLLESN